MPWKDIFMDFSQLCWDAFWSCNRWYVFGMTLVFAFPRSNRSPAPFSWAILGGLVLAIAGIPNGDSFDVPNCLFSYVFLLLGDHACLCNSTDLLCIYNFQIERVLLLVKRVRMHMGHGTILKSRCIWTHFTDERLKQYWLSLFAGYFAVTWAWDEERCWGATRMRLVRWYIAFETRGA